MKVTISPEPLHPHVAVHCVAHFEGPPPTIGDWASTQPYVREYRTEHCRVERAAANGASPGDVDVMFTIAASRDGSDGVRLYFGPMRLSNGAALLDLVRENEARQGESAALRGQLVRERFERDRLRERLTPATDALASGSAKVRRNARRALRKALER